MKRIFIVLLPVLLLACNLPIFIAHTATPPVKTDTPNADELCAFVEARKNLDEVTKQFTSKLKDAGIPIDSARAEAYGENCIAEDGHVVRFAARETDFYVTIIVTNLTDETQLGDLLEKTLAVIDQFPVGQTPGPNPGYIGITYKAGEQVQNLWFTRNQADDFRKQGLKGADLYHKLLTK
jgi:hypothetical protein